MKGFKYADISTANTPTQEKPQFPVRPLVQAIRKASLPNRTKIDIMANILQVANGGAKKTHIMYQCNLSFRQLHAYLNLLVDIGLLEARALKTEDKGNSQLFETTSKGKAFIKAYHSLKALLIT